MASAIDRLGDKLSAVTRQIMPIVAHTGDPTPPADALSGISRDDMGCYTTGCVRTAKGKRVKAAWIGYGVSAGLWAALVSTLVASDGY